MSGKFTAREAEFLAAAFQSLRGQPENGPSIDYEKMAAIMGMTKGSVSNVMGPLKKKVFSGGSDAVNSTPKKTPTKKAPKSGSFTNGTPTPARRRTANGTNGTKGNGHDPFSTPNGRISNDGSPTPTLSQPRRGKTPKRIAADMDENEDDVLEDVQLRSPRKKRAVSLQAIKKETVDHDDEAESSEVTNSMEDPEYEDDLA